MAFWGCEIKPGHPHKVIPAGGIGSQLHLSQATLGIKVKPKERVLLSAQVADEPCVLLCSLTAGSVESCGLDLIFDEEVVFTVEGPTSIHLSGYYMPTMVEEEDEDDEDEDYDDEVEFGDEFDEDEDEEDEEEEEDFLLRGHNNSGVRIEEITEEEAQVVKGSKGGAASVVTPVVTEGNGKTKKKKEKAGEVGERRKVEEDEDGFHVGGGAKKVEAAAGGKKRVLEPASTTERTVKKPKGEAAAVSVKKEAPVKAEPLKAATPAVKAAETPEPGLSKKEKKALSKKSQEGAEESGAAKKGSPVVRSFPNGLQVEEVKLGDPAGKQAKNGKKIVMHYTGKLKGGKVFDSSVGKRPFEFRLGMRVGDKRRLTIPPAMGYGPKGAPPQIPGNAQLTFDIELLNVK